MMGGGREELLVPRLGAVVLYSSPAKSFRNGFGPRTPLCTLTTASTPLSRSCAWRCVMTRRIRDSSKLSPSAVTGLLVPLSSQPSQHHHPLRKQPHPSLRQIQSLRLLQSRSGA